VLSNRNATRSYAAIADLRSSAGADGACPVHGDDGASSEGAGARGYGARPVGRRAGARADGGRRARADGCAPGAGVLFGLTEATPDTAVKAQVTFAFGG
jgi:hypothetical protein